MIGDVRKEERLTAKTINRRNNARRSTGAIERNKGRAPPGADEWWRGGATAGEQKRGIQYLKKKAKTNKKEWESGSLEVRLSEVRLSWVRLP